MRRYGLATISAVALMVGSSAYAQESDLDMQIKVAEVQLAKLKKLKDIRAQIAVLEKETAVKPDTSTTPTPTSAAAPKPLASATTADVEDAAKAGAKAGSQEALRDATTPTQKFGGVDFGVGLAFTYDLGQNDRIREAIVVNDIIRVKEQRNQDAGFLLELHYFFTPNTKFLGLQNDPDTGTRHTDNFRRGESEWGVGPFIAVRPGSDEVIDAIGGGIMLGLKRPALLGSTTNSGSFNIGLGVLYDLGVQILGEGLSANAKLPAGDMLRYRKTSQTGLLLTSSYSF